MGRRRKPDARRACNQRDACSSSALDEFTRAQYSKLLNDGIVLYPGHDQFSEKRRDLWERLTILAETEGLQVADNVGHWDDIAFGPAYLQLLRPNGRGYDFPRGLISPYQTPKAQEIAAVLRPQIEAGWGAVLNAARLRVRGDGCSLGLCGVRVGGDDGACGRITYSDRVF